MILQGLGSRVGNASVETPEVLGSNPIIAGTFARVRKIWPQAMS